MLSVKLHHKIVIKNRKEIIQGYLLLILARKRQTTLCTYYNSEPACYAGLFVSQQTTLLSKLPQWISTIPRIPRISIM